MKRFAITDSPALRRHLTGLTLRTSCASYPAIPLKIWYGRSRLGDIGYFCDNARVPGGPVGIPVRMESRRPVTKNPSSFRRSLPDSWLFPDIGDCCGVTSRHRKTISRKPSGLFWAFRAIKEFISGKKAVQAGIGGFLLIWFIWAVVFTGGTGGSSRMFC